MIFEIILLLMTTLGMGNADGSSADPNVEDYYAKLKQDIFGQRRIDITKRPVLDYRNSVQVTCSLVILHIYRMDEVTGTLTVNGWLEASWVDPQLQWDPSNYGGINYIEVSDTEVWKPDITVINSAEDTRTEYNKAILYVGQDGHVSWNPFFISRTSCSIDHKYFPFDEHLCSIDIGSWNYNNQSLTVRNKMLTDADDDTISKFRVENPLWKIVDTSVATINESFSCCPHATYPFVQHTLRLRRSSPLYKFVLIIPSVMSVILTLTLFWIPPSAGEKITMGGIAVIIQLGLLISLSYIVPPGGINVPHIVLFVGNSFVMTCLALSISVLVIRLSRGHSYTPVPSLVKNMLKGPFGRILCFGPASHQLHADTAILNEEKPESESAEGTENPEPGIPSASYKPSTFGDWVLLATAIDHFCFIVYCIVFALILISSFT